MTEIEIEENETELRLFINGIPDFTLIPKEKYDSFITLTFYVNISDSLFANYSAQNVALDKSGIVL